MSSHVREKAGLLGGLGPSIAHSCKAGREIGRHSIVPTHIVFVIFADWGMKDLRGASSATRKSALQPYYIWRATANVLHKRLLQSPALAEERSAAHPHETAATVQASPAPTPAAAPGSTVAALSMPTGAATAQTEEEVLRHLSDIHFAGGSRSTFIGTVPREQYAALLLAGSGAARAFACCSACGHAADAIGAAETAAAGGGESHSRGADAGKRDYCSDSDQALLELLRPPSVGVGLGLVTQEAYLHPEIPGTCSVDRVCHICTTCGFILRCRCAGLVWSAFVCKLHHFASCCSPSLSCLYRL